MAPQETHRTTDAPQAPAADRESVPDLSLPFVTHTVSILCAGLRSMAAGELQEAGDAFNEAARRIDRACCDEKRRRYGPPITSVSDVRDIVLTHIPLLPQALQHQQAGHRRDAFELLLDMPAALWKAAGYLYEESSRRYGHPTRRTHKDAFFESSGKEHRAIITEALQELTHSPYLERVICEVIGEHKRVSFEKDDEARVELHLPFDALSPKERKRADVFFSSMKSKAHDHRFVVPIDDLSDGAKLAVGVFDVVYDIGDRYDLAIEAK